MAILAALTQLTLAFQNFTGQGRASPTGLSRESDIAAVYLGGNPFNLPSLEFTFLLISIVYAVYRYSVEQSERQGALEQEFKSAQELQQVLIPETLPSFEGYAVTSAYRPAQQVGGDFFQLIALPDGSALLVLGDVSGKGLKAAMTVSLIVGTIRTVADTVDDPSEVLSILNRRLYGRLKDGFVTCLALRLDPDGGLRSGECRASPAFLNKTELSSPGALPLGLDLDRHTRTQRSAGRRRPAHPIYRWSAGSAQCRWRNLQLRSAAGTDRDLAGRKASHGRGRCLRAGRRHHRNDPYSSGSGCRIHHVAAGAGFGLLECVAAKGKLSRA